ncbi:MAG: phosphoserine phosphatase SerB, partial [Alphaproteobacteria bacterium]|nr:phosphoserine phosphatase SerB [Alphaproteobacteria bacterium]
MTETTHVLTLIAKPLTADHVEAARAALPRRPRIDWLAADEACDLYFETAAAADVAAAVRRVLAGQPVDLHCRPNDPDRRCRLMIADMDSTMITVECIDEMAAVLGERKRIAEITERAMQGDIDFADALRERAAILAGLEEVALQWVYDARIHLSPGARELVATMRA